MAHRLTVGVDAALRKINPIWAPHFGDMDPLILAVRARERKCRMPVDMIYGGLGIANPVQIVPDYEKSARDVYQQYAARYLEYYQSLKLLHYVRETTAEYSLSELAGLASWVPNWWQPYDVDIHPYPLKSLHNASEGRSFRSSTEMKPDGTFILHSHGTEVGALMKSFQAYEQPSEDTWAPHWQLCIDLVDETINSDHSIDRAGILALTARLLSADTQNSYRVAPDLIAKQFQAYVQLHSDDGFTPLPKDFQEDTPENVRDARAFFDSADGACDCRVVFSTSNGHLGLAPRMAKAGDIAVILYGHQWPVILRAVGDQYLFLGEAYVYGVMDGEAVQGDNVVDKVFSIH